MAKQVISYSLFSDFDIELFKAGKHFNLYEKFGAHLKMVDETEGVYFAVYAPSASNVEVIGDFNAWEGNDYALNVRWDESGIWEGFIPRIKEGDLYKYRIYSNHDEKIREKADPYAFKTEMMPKSASVVWKSNYQWQDKNWMTEGRPEKNHIHAPFSIYEVHLGSWRKKGGRSLHYSEMADEMVKYVEDLGFTHIEFMPLTEHPYYPSWGYLSTSFFAPTSRYGEPEELMYLIDEFHKSGIGVIMDWVPAHFPNDEFALADFDGSCVYEHFDLQKGFHPDWNSLIFNYERAEVRSFLISSAFYWIEKFHIDGLRVDAVSSMLYLDYSRDEGQWSPNIYGGNEYLAAIEFIKELNTACYSSFPGIQIIAEESTAFPGVTTPVEYGGLGFGMKWMMGWMNDTLEYFSKDPIHRTFHHSEISFSLTYAFSENFLLPLSHDEVVHGKQSIISKMPGDDWQKFANLRLLYSYMYTHPGNKLLFMGNEIAQTSEWNFNQSIDWHLLKHLPHQGIQKLLRDLNGIYKTEKALFDNNFSMDGFEWISHDDNKNCVLVYLRNSGDERIVVICNFTPQVVYDYKVGVPFSGKWEVILNSDDIKYSGSGAVTNTHFNSVDEGFHDKPHSLNLTLVPLGTLILKLI